MNYLSSSQNSSFYTIINQTVLTKISVQSIFRMNENENVNDVQLNLDYLDSSGPR